MANLKKEGHIILLVFVVVIAISIVSSVQISNFSLPNATTEDVLHCSWNNSIDTYNITVYWYNGSNLYEMLNTSINSTKHAYVSEGIHKRGEVWNCTVVLKNITGQSSVGSKKIVIANARPGEPQISNQTIQEDQLWSGAITATDADNDAVTFTYSYYNSSLDSFESNGNYAWTPDYGEIGLHRFQFISIDGQPGGINEKTVWINVSEVNDPPEFVGWQSLVQVYEGQKLWIEISATDEENPSGPFNFSINSSYVQVKGEERLILSGNNASGTNITTISGINLTYDDTGNYYVTVVLFDPVDMSINTTQTFNLKVNTTNHKPNITGVYPQNGTEGSSLSIEINASDFDPQDTLTLTVTPLDCSISNPWIVLVVNSSANATWNLNLTPINNSHVICRNVTLTVEDGSEEYSLNVFFNLTNVNDPPIIYNNSHYAYNSFDNIILQNLTGYTDLQFKYRVNGTDPDVLTYDADVLNFTSNATDCITCPYFVINSTTGEINFTPTSSFVGNFSYEIILTDGTLETTETMRVEIIPNSAPTFNQTPTDQTGFEDVQFYYMINGSDIDNNFQSISINTSEYSFSQSGQSGIFNFYPTCSQIGTHSVEVKINDSFGATTTAKFNLTINNTNDAPTFNFDTVARNAMELREFSINFGQALYYTDNDTTCLPNTDSHTFTASNLTGGMILSISSDGEIDFTPSLGEQGYYEFQINVTDLANATDSMQFNLTVLNDSSAPEIKNITAWNPADLTAWRPTVFYPLNITNPAVDPVYENTTVIFNHTTTDADGDPLVYAWYFDGQYRNNTLAYIRYFDFTTAGSHLITLRVADNVSGIIANNVSFTWDYRVANVNRPPILVNPLPNMTDVDSITGTITKEKYLVGLSYPDYHAQNTRFYDEDNDTLNFTVNNYNNSIVTISIGDDGDTTFTPVLVGVTTISFNTSDGYANLESNYVVVNVSYVPPVETEEILQQQTSTREVIRYQSVLQEVEKQVTIFLDIITPQPTTLYLNNTLRAPITVENKGNFTLRGISLAAVTNITGITIDWSDNFIPTLEPGESIVTDLILTAYKTFSTYEIVIYANVTDPEYSDKAVIYVNSVEKSKGNTTQTNTKITFARDLLSSNPECLELNEFILEAERQLAAGNFARANEILDSVVQGCKYLVSQTQLRAIKPTGFAINIDYDPAMGYIAAAVIFTIISMAFALHRSKRKHHKKEEI